MTLVYGDVCSGISAPTVAWGSLGWRAAFYSEIESFPRAVLGHHYPDTPLRGDFRMIQAGDHDAIELLVGGTPCQSFSVAGKRLGLDDPRGNLAIEFVALARRLGARWLVWENVPGVLSSNEGRDFGAFLGLLGDGGYGWAYRVLDAQYVRVDGHARAVPQRRRRVFLVGYLGDWRPPAAVLFEREGLLGHPAPRREAGKGPAGGTLRGTDGGSDLDHARAGHLIAAPILKAAFGGNNTAGPVGVATAVRAKGGTGHGDFESETFVAEQAPALSGNQYGDHESREGLLVAHALTAEGFDASDDGTGRGTPLVPVAGSLGSDHGNTRADQAWTGRLVPVAFDARQSDTVVYGDQAGALDSDGYSQAVAFAERGTNLSVDGDHAATLKAAGSGGGGRLCVAFAQNSRSEVRAVGGDGAVTGALTVDPGVQQQTYVASGEPTASRSFASGEPTGVWQVRRLTPRECERLQGFPDDYTLIPFDRRVRKRVDAEMAAYWRRLDPALTDDDLRHLAADGPRYKALGNSMAVNVVRWIGQRIALFESLGLAGHEVACEERPFLAEPAL